MVLRNDRWSIKKKKNNNNKGRLQSWEICHQPFWGKVLCPNLCYELDLIKKISQGQYLFPVYNSTTFLSIKQIERRLYLMSFFPFIFKENKNRNQEIFICSCFHCSLFFFIILFWPVSSVIRFLFIFLLTESYFLNFEEGNPFLYMQKGFYR